VATLQYISIIETSNVSMKIVKERFYVYVLFSLKDRGLYIGYTTDLKQRLSQHANGNVFSTSFRRPFLLIHYEYFINKHDAKAREIFLKGGYGRKQLQKKLHNTSLSLQDE
jgi:putative endonuclease